MDEYETWYRNFYAKKDTDALLGLLERGMILEGARPAALAVLAERGLSQEQLATYLAPRPPANKRGEADVEDTGDLLAGAIEILGDLVDPLD